MSINGINSLTVRNYGLAATGLPAGTGKAAPSDVVPRKVMLPDGVAQNQGGVAGASGVMSGNFVFAQSESSRYVDAAIQAFSLNRQFENQRMSRVAALLASLDGSEPEAKIQRALKRIKDAEAAEASERNLEEIRDDIERRTEKAQAESTAAPPAAPQPAPQPAPHPELNEGGEPAEAALSAADAGADGAAPAPESSENSAPASAKPAGAAATAPRPDAGAAMSAAAYQAALDAAQPPVAAVEPVEITV